jgi:hypothetical protein
MRPSERQRNKEGRSGILLTRLADDGIEVQTDAAFMTEDEIHDWVDRCDQGTLKTIVFNALLEARQRRPRL